MFAGKHSEEDNRKDNYIAMIYRITYNQGRQPMVHCIIRSGSLHHCDNNTVRPLMILLFCAHTLMHVFLTIKLG